MIDKSITIASDDTWVYAFASLNGEELARDADASSLIQTALDKLKGTGGRIMIEPGTYVLTKPLQLHGRTQLKGAGPATILSVCESNPDGAGLMLASVNNVTVADICIEASFGSKASKSGIVVDNCADCSFNEVFCLNFSEYGFLVRNGSAFCKLTNCKAANNAKANFCLSHLDRFRTGDYGDFVPNLVSSCYSYGGGTGFLADKALCQNFIACVAYQSGKAAFHVANWSNSTLISGCRSFQTEEQAVLIEDSSEINVSSSIFCWQRGHGIEVKNSTWGTICGNEIMDAGASSDSYKYNLYMHTDVKSYQVTGNVLFTWADQRPTESGIYETEDCCENSFVGNAINYYKKEGLVSLGKQSKASENIMQPDAWPNPGEPFAKPNENHGNYNNPFDRSRMQAYLEQTAIAKPLAKSEL
ncbi:MAG: hypothetical protein AAGA45_01590 [Verrucomicrobiota bacterium]